MRQANECPRRWQAEAIEDGRLDGADRTSFEKHAQACSSCGDEVAILSRLRQTMEQSPAASSTALEHRRLRAALLRRADEQALHAPRGGGWRIGGWAFAAVTVTVAMLLAARFYGDRSFEPAPPAFDIQDVHSAVWTTQTLGATTRVTLASGSASFHVRRTTGSQRFLLELPDGEIEVHGTRFLVDLAGEGRTRRVEVSEGVVTLRLRGDPDRDLRAGDRWDRPAPAVAPPAEALERSAPAPSAAPSHDAPRSADRPEPAITSDAFGAGVAAFRAGDFGRAEHLLNRFVQQSPSDPRIEDACFLRAVARARSGDAEGAAKLAKDYLRRFPQGLRRPEAERMAAGK